MQTAYASGLPCYQCPVRPEREEIRQEPLPVCWSNLPWAYGYIVKTVLESRNLVSNLTYWSLSDNMAHLDFSFAGSELAGSLGLITYNGMHKSAYYAMRLLRMLKGSVLAEGDGYIILKDDSDFLIMLYQYCHYDKASIKRMIASQIVSDPYTMCVSGERQVFSIEISNADIRSYSMESFSIGRRSGGNLYENWHRFGNPRRINELQRSYLEGISQPAYRIGEIAPDNGILHISCVVEPHDVILIRLSPL